MSTDDRTTGQGGYPGGWEPIPQSEGYDGDATAFVQLPPDFMLDGVPLEAPGHGYVPPMITPLQPLDRAATDPAATGSWTVHVPTEAEQTQYFEQPEYPGHPQYEGQPEYPGADGHAGRPEYPSEYDGQPGYDDGVGQSPYEGRIGHAGYAPRADYADRDPHATAEWRFDEAATPASGTTGQWEIPVVAEAPDAAGEDSGEFAPSTAASYAEAPATLPGGAPAPWALPEEPAAEAAPEDGGDAEEGQDGQDGLDGDEATAAPDAHEAPATSDAISEQAPDGGPDGPDALDEPHGTSGSAEPGEQPVRDDEQSAPDEHDGDPVVPAAAGATPAPNPYASTDSDEHPHTSYTLRVNGADRPVTGSWIGESLLYVLRERLGLAGAKDGCSQGECGACNVQVDGRLVASCLVPAATAAGSEVRTVEGLAADGEPSDVQRAMSKCGTVQCGFCIPGMCMTVHDLLEGNHAPTDLETRQALAGNLCRCSGYRGVLEAVRDVVAEREASAAATAAEASDEIRVPHQIPHPHDGGMA
ncbi:2Fe-2S iron-sulfur cluster-binding protein [Streptomyces wedmorensis]|uniref:2Fe-2S iron-sulfur cluster-binding protein n=1 Tax=Streptomyces wedmorensis TaxID=43759 RepID=UPI00343DBD1F